MDEMRISLKVNNLFNLSYSDLKTAVFVSSFNMFAQLKGLCFGMLRMG